MAKATDILDHLISSFEPILILNHVKTLYYPTDAQIYNSYIQLELL